MDEAAARRIAYTLLEALRPAERAAALYWLSALADDAHELTPDQRAVADTVMSPGHPPYELAALRWVHAALAGLVPTERQRVLGWLRQQFPL
ncbi:hypothetical protein [Streptomyces sp. Ac-502]|uniref:hypothetical protein n=1 Tax=Streptomyces sp. Ac-502 TaxID=3342801 RepID=UPI003862BE84